MAWAMGRSNLDKSPIATHMSLANLSAFMGMTLSAIERDVQPSPSERTKFSRSLFELKESLAAIFTSFASKDNSSGRKWQAFRLVVQNDSDTLIFANTLRHDKDSGSICLDAHVVPLTPQRIQNLSRVLVRTLGAQQVLGIKVSEHEESLWKHVMPAFVERCRHSWKHKPSCEYITPSLACPRSVLHGEIAICSCGEGQDVASIPREFRVFSQFATRIAITPLSAVPYVELMALDSVLSSGVVDNPTLRHEHPTDYPETQMDTCGQCGSADSDLKACAGCNSVKYCNKSCQGQAWRSHKLECRSKRTRGQ